LLTLHEILSKWLRYSFQSVLRSGNPAFLVTWRFYASRVRTIRVSDIHGKTGYNKRMNDDLKSVFEFLPKKEEILLNKVEFMKMSFKEYLETKNLMISDQISIIILD
jgi:hypothetical protein